jgi:hypothetical protein
LNATKSEELVLQDKNKEQKPARRFGGLVLIYMKMLD